MSYTRTLSVGASAGIAFLSVAGSVVAEDAEGPLTVYSGRSQALLGPVLDAFTDATGVEVETKYADTAELAAILLEEGDRSPADVFFAQDAGALGAVAEAGRFASLDEDLLARVPPRFRDPDDGWVGVSGRARTAVYTTAADIDLPGTILAFTDPQWAGRLGWAPANGSFQAFVTALRVIEGEEAARAWLEGILANDPIAYPANAAAVEGVASGEVDVAFVNHYYLLRLTAEHGDDYPVAQVYFEGGDPGALINVAGVGHLVTSDQPAAAAALIEHLLADETQSYFGGSTYEYPLVEGIAADPRLPHIETIEVPDLDLSSLADLRGTVELLRDVGAID